jgi:hypothetical protein
MNVYSVFQCPVDRAFLSDLEELFALRFGQAALQGDGTIDHINPVVLIIAAAAVFDMFAAMFESDMHALKRDALAISIHFQGHRRATSQRREQQIIRRWTAISTPQRLWLISKKDMFPNPNRLLELAASGLDGHEIGIGGHDYSTVTDFARLRG